MRKALTLLLVGAFASLGGPALACSVPPPPTLRNELPRAKHVFLFRLESVSEISKGSEQGEVIGRIVVTRVFRGRPDYKRVRFATRWCGGNRLDVGHTFLAVSSKLGDVLTLALADETIIDITNASNRQQLYAALEQGKLPAGFPSREQSNYTLTFGYPPPE